MIDTRLMINEFDKLSREEQSIFAMMMVGGVEAILQNKSAAEYGIVPLQILIEMYGGAIEDIRSGKFIRKNNNV